MTSTRPAPGPAEPLRLLTIVAHPDDETFGCGSLLLHAAAAGVQTVVACATRGEAGDIATGIDAPDGVAALREAELRDAARLLGVTEVEVLGFGDSGMEGEPAIGTLCGATSAELTEAVRAVIDRHRPHLVVTLDGSDGHRDHQRLRGVVEQLLIGTSTSVYLQCLPRSLMHDWVRHQAGDERSAAYVELPDIGTPDEQLTTIIDTEAHLATRVAAIALHRSQHSPFDGLPDHLRRGFLGRDHLIRVNPPWLGGPIEEDLSSPRGF